MDWKKLIAYLALLVLLIISYKVLSGSVYYSPSTDSTYNTYADICGVCSPLKCWYSKPSNPSSCSVNSKKGSCIKIKPCVEGWFSAGYKCECKLSEAIS